MSGSGAGGRRRADRVSRLGQILTGRAGTLAVAESLTGGLLVQELAKTEGSGEWLRGVVVAYASEVKHEPLGVTAAKVVSAAAADQMAAGARDVLGADVAVAVTGVTGPIRRMVSRRGRSGSASPTSPARPPSCCRRAAGRRTSASGRSTRPSIASSPGSRRDA